MKNLMTMFTPCVLKRKYPFYGKFASKNQNYLKFGQNLEP